MSTGKPSAASIRQPRLDILDEDRADLVCDILESIHNPQPAEHKGEHETGNDEHGHHGGAPLMRSSQIFCDGPELPQGRISLPAGGSDRLIKAMIDVIVDQRLLGVVDRILDRLQLLSKFEAGPPAFDHADDRLKMPFRAPETTDDLGMVLVLH